jgi:protocatechuate 3,4-dioxygenase beta subunit
VLQLNQNGMKIYSAFFYFITISCTSLAQDDAKMIQQTDADLANGKTTISRVLSDKNYMQLHPVTEFREVIKKYAKAEKIIMVTGDEPGTKITVKAVVKNKSGELFKNVLVYLYQTSDKGWYAADRPHVGGNEGDHGHARLFTYIKTNDKGEFEINTIMPKGYPNSDLPAHIHIQMWKDGKNIPGVPGELLFEEDERLTPERKQRSIREGYLVEKNKGSSANPVYQYTIVVSG